MESIAPKILNINGLNNIEKEIDKLEDLCEKEIRQKLIEAIWDKIIDYDAHVLRYDYEQHCRKLIERGLEFVPVEKNGVAASWDTLFASSVSEQAKQRSDKYNEQYKWHLFSFGLLEALKAADAAAAFDAQAKGTLCLFYQHADKAYLVKNAFLLKAEDLNVDSGMDKADIYVFDPINKWTYVKTHEATCGPYFYRTK